MESCVGFRLPQRNATRWNSDLHLLKGLVQLVDSKKAMESNALNRLNAISKHGHLSASELVVLRELVSILNPFERASDDFQSDKETIGNVIPLYLGLLNMLTLTVRDARTGESIPNPHSSLAPIVKKLKGFVQTLHDSLERRFAFVLFDSNYVMGKCCVLNNLD